MTNLNDFYWYNELFLNLGAVNSPAEVQGMLTGKLVCGQTVTKDDWLGMALVFMDLEHVELGAEQQSAIESLFELTTSQLEADDFTFTLLLPDDQSSIARRTQELAFWCQGFLHGVGTAGITGESTFSAEAADAIRDLAQISQAEVDEEQDDETNETDLTELVEYVKVAVLTVQNDLQGKRASASDGQDPTIH